MILVIDAGNTNIVFAVYEGEEQMEIWRCPTHDNFPAIEYEIESVIVGSVVPALDQKIRTFSQEKFSCGPVFVTHDNAGVSTNLDRPDEAGADRLINAVAAVHYYRSPAIIVDFGTATTFDVVNGDGIYCGGAIAPGPKLSMEALHRAAAKLPKIEIERPASVIGTNTVAAMQSGLYWGYVGLIEGILSRIEQEMTEKPLIIATGGLAHLFTDAIPAIETVDDELTLKGLLQIHHQHR